MGIDVWTLRGASTPCAPQSAQPAREEVAVGPEFHLCFLNYRSFAICLSLDQNEKVISVSARAFCDDVALALNGSAVNPGINNLRWPNRAAEDHSAKAADSAVLQRVNALPGLMLIFGQTAASVIPGVVDPVSGQVLELNGRQVLLFNAIDELCQGASGKRTLWQILQRYGKFP